MPAAEIVQKTPKRTATRDPIAPIREGPRPGLTLRIKSAHFLRLFSCCVLEMIDYSKDTEENQHKDEEAE
jgi:hypothetical protein